jgi:hypothetical protein
MAERMCVVKNEKFIVIAYNFEKKILYYVIELLAKHIMCAKNVTMSYTIVPTKWHNFIYRSVSGNWHNVMLSVHKLAQCHIVCPIIGTMFC